MLKQPLSPRDRAEAALISHEFQSSVIRLILNAFPGKKRLVHVHIHKTAGLDLKHQLTKRYVGLHDSLSKAELTPKPKLFQNIRQFIDRIDDGDSIYVGGHFRLTWCLDNSLFRLGDRLFTVVRHPYDIVISYINFILKRFAEDPRLTRTDTRDWANGMDLDEIPAPMSDSDAFQIASRLLVNRQIILGNFLTSHLGKGTVESALELMACTNIEITEISRYKQWLKQGWRIDTNTRTNHSPQRIRYADLTPPQQEYVNEICAEDVKLYTIISEAFNTSDSDRIFGYELV